MKESETNRGVDPHLHVGEGYDRLAPDYDNEISTSLVARRMRGIFRREMLNIFREGDRVLEIGCGTGSDAIWVAQLGLQVVATDNSQGMIDEAVRKVNAVGLADSVLCRKASARDIGLLQKEFGPESFDGGFCHAGALNMEPHLSRVPGQLRRLLVPKGRFICSVVNKTSLFEALFYPMILRPRKGFRRLDNVVPIPISRDPPLNRYVVRANFYSPNDLKKIFSPHFSLEALRGMQILLPPANLTREYEAVRPLLKVVELLEESVASRRPLNSWGNHSILTFKRNE